jgi:hypothetical protein
MKTPNLLRSAAILTLFSIVLFSCSKDALPKPDSNDAKTGDVKNLKSHFAPATDDVGYGELQGLITPVEAKYSVTVYNEFYRSEEVFPDERGYVVVTKLEEGTYTVFVHPYNGDYRDFEIRDVRIVRDEITDLGEINF